MKFKNEVRLLANDAFELYAMDTGNFPADSPPGVVPAGIEKYLPRHFDWGAGVLGGQWDWDRAVDRNSKIHGVYAGLSIVKPLRTSLQMREIDKEIDDGDLTTGIFRSRPDGYIYTVEE